MMKKIDRKIVLIRQMQAEIEHRSEVEEKAVQLIGEGKYEEAVALLQSLDDYGIQRMREEFDAIEAEEAAGRTEEAGDEACR